MSYCHTIVASPVGDLTLVASGEALCAVLFARGRGEYERGASVPPDRHPVLREAARQLKEYFSGARKIFDLPLAPAGSAFRQRAWQELARIPYGQTITYGEQARRMGSAKKARAVGQANGDNPIGIIIPCHRVIGANGALTGFGGGVGVKKILLDFERLAA